MKLIKAIDNYFFMNDDTEIKPYFYAALAVGLIAVLLILGGILN